MGCRLTGDDIGISLGGRFRSRQADLRFFPSDAFAGLRFEGLDGAPACRGECREVPLVNHQIIGIEVHRHGVQPQRSKALANIGEPDLGLRDTETEVYCSKQ